MSSKQGGGSSDDLPPDDCSPEVLNALEEFARQLRNAPDTRYHDYLEKVHASHHGLLLWLMVKCVKDDLKLDEDEFQKRFTGCKQQFPQYAEQLDDFQQRRQRKKGAPVGAPCISPEIYSRIELHAAGGQGAVYKAIHTSTGTPVALKVIWASGPAQRAPEATEISLLRGLRHERIVRLLDCFQNVKTVKNEAVDVLVEEWIDGPTLRDYFDKAAKAKGRLSTTESLRITFEIVEGLSYIHASEAFHLDLKMSNILLRGNDHRPVIVDFGGSVRRRNRHDIVALTWEYAAPELLVRASGSRKAHINARTDIFSVGVILYQLLTRVLPYEAKSIDELINLFDDGNPPDSPRSLVPEISESVNRICLKCLAIDQNERYSSAQDLLDALSTVPEAIPLRSPQQTVEQRVLKLLPMEQLDRPFYESLIAAASQSPRFTNSDSLIQQLRSRSTDAPKIIALSAPSGAGKSSWLRAWLLPELLQDGQTSICRLDANESDNSASEHTFDLLQHELRVHLSAASTDGSEISTAVELIREVVAGRQLSKNVKLLIVIDQFEQWLLRYGRDETSNLLNALRECNGHRVQALLIFRSDYENLVKPTMRLCDEAFHDGANAFDLPAVTKPAIAAETLLHLLGAVGKFQDQADIPGSPSLRQSAEQLLGTTAGDAILPVQIVLLAKFCLKHTELPNPLAGYDKFDDIVQLHVNELFQKSITTPAEHQLLLDIIRRLLPTGSSQARQTISLDDVLGLKKPSTAALQHLLDCLKSNGVIMPVAAPTDVGSTPPAALWQLTHEFWIEPLRNWVDDQPQTDREKLLWKLTDRWQHDRRAANLPTFLEYLQIWRVPCRSSREAQFLTACRRHFVLRALALAIVAIAGVLLTLLQQIKTRKEIIDNSTPAALLDLPDVPSVYRPFIDVPAIVRNKLGRFDSPDIDSQIPCHITLLRYQSINDPQNDDSIQFLLDHLPQVGPKYQKELTNTLTLHKDRVLPRLTNSVRNPREKVNKFTKQSHLTHLAILAVFLDRFDDAQTALGQTDGDQSVLSEFILHFNDWTIKAGWPTAINYDRLKNRPRLLFAILQAADDEPTDKRVGLTDLVNLSIDHPQAEVASTASRMKKSESEHDATPTIVWGSQSHPAYGSNWRTDEFAGLILVDTRIPVASGNSLWASDSEISWGHIRKLCPDLLPEDLQNDSKDDSLPAIKVNPSLLFGFINRLNHEYSMPDTYRRIMLNGKEKWEPIPDAKGFRLPTLQEYRKMALAVAPAYRALGNHLDVMTYGALLQKYGHVDSFTFEKLADINSKGYKEYRRLPIRSLRPNSLGLFDILGNVSEVVVDDDIARISDSCLFGENSVLRVVGGDYINNELQTFLSDAKAGEIAVEELAYFNVIGFRVVCDGKLPN